MTKTADVDLIRLTKRYGDTVAVDAIDLKIPGGTYCCLLGPSGCGKTSTLRMIAGHEEISEGDLLIGDVHVNDLPPARRATAMMFQSYALFNHMTVKDNIAFGLKIKRMGRSQMQQRVADALGHIHIEECPTCSKTASLHTEQ